MKSLSTICLAVVRSFVNRRDSVLLVARRPSAQQKENITNAKKIMGMVVLAMFLAAGVVQAGLTTLYGYSGSETTITLNPGLYVITAYGAQGGSALGGGGYYGSGGLGAEMSGEFNFSTSTTLTLLVGGAGISGAGGYWGSGGGGGGSFVVNGSTVLVIAGGGGGVGGYSYAGVGGSGNVGTGGGGGGSFAGDGGVGGTGGYGGAGGGSKYTGGTAGGGGGYYGSGGNGYYGGLGGSSFLSGGTGGGYSGGGGSYEGYGGGGGSIIDSSGIIVAEVSGIASPDYSPNGEIIITEIPEPATLLLLGLGGLAVRRFRR